MRLIDADALLDTICGAYNILESGGIDMTIARSITVAIINEVPTVKPKRGKWEFVQYDANPKIGNYHCSQCGLIAEPLSYCPNCGAKMEVEMNERD
jgi:predicted RNA-binding Zn-ribbon protein involved in translation (DUF1610 family)